MSRLDEMRLMAKVARMYYDQGIRQQDITERLNIHQSKISRMLKRAREANIVRISIATPAGFFPELEDALEIRFHLKDAVVVDSEGDEERLVRDLGAAAAFYLETTLKPGMVIGISSWSRSLFAMVEMLHPNTVRGRRQSGADPRRGWQCEHSLSGYVARSAPGSPHRCVPVLFRLRASSVPPRQRLYWHEIQP